jgi:urease accessory protein UreF
MAVRPTFTIGDVFTAANANILAQAIVAINAQTGTAYTTVLSDAGKLITITNAASQTVTIPPNASVAYGVGDQINIMALSTATTTLAAGSAVTLNSNGAKLILNGQYAVATCLKIGSPDTWVVVGNVKA